MKKEISLNFIAHMTTETKSGSGFTGRKVKGTLHWVDAMHNIPADFHLYEPLLMKMVKMKKLKDYHS